jgi:hypothetical protein
VYRTESRLSSRLVRMATYTPSSPAFHMTPAAAKDILEQTRCVATTRAGRRCKLTRCRGLSTCSVHSPPDECPICYEHMKACGSYETPCGHRFHMNCILRWKDEGKTTCPMCRKEVFEPEPYYFPRVINGEIRMVQVVDQDIISWLRMLNLH